MFNILNNNIVKFFLIFNLFFTHFLFSGPVYNEVTESSSGVKRKAINDDNEEKDRPKKKYKPSKKTIANIKIANDNKKEGRIWFDLEESVKIIVFRNLYKDKNILEIKENIPEKLTLFTSINLPFEIPKIREVIDDSPYSNYRREINKFKNSKSEKGVFIFFTDQNYNKLYFYYQLEGKKIEKLSFSLKNEVREKKMFTKSNDEEKSVGKKLFNVGDDNIILVSKHSSTSDISTEKKNLPKSFKKFIKAYDIPVYIPSQRLIINDLSTSRFAEEINIFINRSYKTIAFIFFTNKDSTLLYFYYIVEGKEIQEHSFNLVMGKKITEKAKEKERKKINREEETTNIIGDKEKREIVIDEEILIIIEDDTIDEMETEAEAKIQDDIENILLFNNKRLTIEEQNKFKILKEAEFKEWNKKAREISLFYKENKKKEKFKESIIEEVKKFIKWAKESILIYEQIIQKIENNIFNAPQFSIEQKEQMPNLKIDNIQEWNRRVGRIVFLYRLKDFDESLLQQEMYEFIDWAIKTIKDNQKELEENIIELENIIFSFPKLSIEEKEQLQNLKINKAKEWNKKVQKIVLLYKKQNSEEFFLQKEMDEFIDWAKSFFNKKSMNQEEVIEQVLVDLSQNMKKLTKLLNKFQDEPISK